MIELSDISKTYQLGSSKVKALEGINLTVNQGQFTGFNGPSGSGKTTLLRIIGLLETPTKGEYYMKEEELSGKSHRERSRYRGKYFGFIFQTFNLIPELTVYENVEIPLMIAGDGRDSKEERIKQVCQEVGLGEHLRHRPAELSGGQMQRVSVARALVKNPSVILADEPTANLDRKTGSSILELMAGMNKRHGTTFLFATHDTDVTEYLGQTQRITDGQLVRE